MASPPPAVDRKARQLAVALLERYLAKQANNDELSDTWPRDTTDPALKEIYWFVWFLYDDLSTHHTREGDAEALERPLAFLRSDEPYVWPCTRWWETLLSTALAPLTFGLSFQLPWWRIFPKPHWPFATPEQAERYCPRTRIT